MEQMTPGLRPRGLPFLLPMSLLLLQAVVPLVARSSHSTSPQLLPSPHPEASVEATSDEADPYHPASVALLADGLKFLGALAILLVAAWWRPGATVATVAAEIPGRFGRAVVTHVDLVLPAMFYFFSNVLALHALSHLRFSIFSAIMNTRTVFAAVVSMPLLHKHMNGEQWRALAILVCAATMLSLEDVQLDSKFTLHQESMGMFLAIATALVSAVAGSLAEKYLNAEDGAGHEASVAVVPQRTKGDIDSSSKPAPHSKEHSSLLWEQQAVLALFSAVFAVVYVLLFHADTLQAGQLFQGWNGTTVQLALLSAAQGLVVALTIQHCGVLTRLIIGSLAMCLCIVLEGLLFNEAVVFQKLLAIVMLLVGANLYFTASASSSSSSSSYQPLQRGAGAVQHGSSSKGEDDGQGRVFKEGKAETRIQSRRGFSSLRSPFPFKNAVDNSTSIKRLTALLVLALIYISVSSYVSVMLASGGLMDGAKGEGEAAAAVSMMHTSAQENDRELVGGKEDEAAEVLLPAEDGKALSSPEPAVAGKEVETEAAAASEKAADGLSEELRQSYFSSFLEDLSTSDDGLLKAAAIMLARKHKSGGCEIEEAKKADSWELDNGIRRDIGLCMQIKDDASIIDEHLAFHWAQGVRKFIIYDDGSEDNPWSVLEKYAALGIVEYHDMTGHYLQQSVTLQLNNMNECFTSFRERAEEIGVRWVVFADLDEFFLSSVPGETLSDTLNNRYKGQACLQIARTWYGSSYRHEKPSGLVTETYLLASPDHADGYPKLLANIYPMGNVTKNATHLYSIHDFEDQDEIPCILKNSIKDVRINHYLRSLEEYDKKSIFGPSQQERVTQPLKKFFDRDRNTHLSLVASEYACQVHALMEQMQAMVTEGKIPEVERPRPWNETHTR